MEAKGTWKESEGSVLRQEGRTGPEKNLHFLFTMNNAVWRNHIDNRINSIIFEISTEKTIFQNLYRRNLFVTIIKKFE